MHIGLYFGSFNPIHIGHCIIANYVLQHAGLQQVWMIVSPQNPFKPSGSLLNEYQRLHLVKLAFEGEPNIKVSDIEFHLPKPSFTIDTLTYLTEKYPQHHFTVIMGSDSFQNLGKWKNAESLIKNYSFLVYERTGFKYNNNLGAKAAQIKAPLLEISSTNIREMIKSGKSVRFLVPDAVKEEIEKTGYYK